MREAQQVKKRCRYFRSACAIPGYLVMQIARRLNPNHPTVRIPDPALQKRICHVDVTEPILQFT
jgi:hypothetical protein